MATILEDDTPLAPNLSQKQETPQAAAKSNRRKYIAPAAAAIVLAGIAALTIVQIRKNKNAAK